jgi:microcystin degradation protein MlrC
VIRYLLEVLEDMSERIKSMGERCESSRSHVLSLAAYLTTIRLMSLIMKVGTRDTRPWKMQVKLANPYSACDEERMGPRAIWVVDISCRVRAALASLQAGLSTGADEVKRMHLTNSTHVPSSSLKPKECLEVTKGFGRYSTMVCLYLITFLSML